MPYQKQVFMVQQKAGAWGTLFQGFTKAKDGGFLEHWSQRRIGEEC